ncbi:MAG: type II toxin-antitoxin system VapB family antitoxin [Rhodothermales bacterium]|nr:type II toxin-antitoxin system VapB family antitoxin [Rhodothermales bacterium]
MDRRKYAHGLVGRTNIVIDDDLMDEVLRVTGIRTRREAVDRALRTLLARERRQEVLQYRGKLKWGWHEMSEGDDRR